jgi:hypothetical protein
MGISFKPFHGIPYEKFLINRIYPDGKIKRIGKMLAPHRALAHAKALELWTAEPPGCTLTVETPAEARARYQVSQDTGKKKRKKK